MIQLGLDNVYPSAGHNDRDPGAIANGYKEADVVKLIRDLMIEELTKRSHPFNTDKNWENNRQYQGRIRRELKTGDVVMDLHMDAAQPSASGITVFVSKNAGVDSKALAKETLEGLVKITGINSRGVKSEAQTQHSRIGILNLVGTAILIELGFITNKVDLNKVLKNKKEIAAFLVKMLIKYDRNK